MWKSSRRAPSLRVLPWHFPYKWGKKHGKTSVRVIFLWYMIYLLSAIGLSHGGSTHLHTNNTQNNTNNNWTTQITNNVKILNFFFNRTKISDILPEDQSKLHVAGETKFTTQTMLCNTRSICVVDSDMWLSVIHRVHCCVSSATMTTRTRHNIILTLPIL
jgi:hypothetical protein